MALTKQIKSLVDRLEKKHGVMGPQHASKPVLPDDKVISKRHKDHRKEIDKSTMKLVPKLHKSNAYHKQHAKEHLEQKDKNDMLLKYLGAKNA